MQVKVKVPPNARLSRRLPEVMDKPIPVLMIHEHAEPFKLLEAALSGLPVESYTVRGIKEERDPVAQYQPLLVFVDLSVWRQAYGEIVEMELDAEQSFSIIVVGPKPDIENYVDAVGKGAFEFIAPPFSPESINRVVKSAATDALFRREALAKVPQPYTAG
jgi:DNA-binding NtrC family response regulator